MRRLSNILGITNKKDEFPLIGISFKFIKEYINQGLKELDNKTVSTHEFVEQIIKPRTKKNQSAAIDEMDKKLKFDKRRQKDPNKHVVFISHAWKYRILDVIEAIEAFRVQNDIENLYIWFDVFNINQHKIQEYPTDFFTKTFHDAIKEIGHTLFVLCPWNDPEVVKR